MANIMATEPAHDAAAVTPSDSGQLSPVARALYIGAGGDVKVTMEGGTDITFAEVLGGTILPVKATKVFATGTTATDIIALY